MRTQHFLLLSFLLYFACPAISADYFPVQVGNWWRFQFVSDPSLSEKGGLVFAMPRDSMLENGERCTAWYWGDGDAPVNDGSVTFLLNSGNDILIIDGDSIPRFMQHDFPEFSANDTLWRHKGDAKVYRIGSFDTKAGSFRNCVAIEEISSRTRYIFAPDIGLAAIDMYCNETRSRVCFMSLEACNVGGISVRAYTAQTMSVVPSLAKSVSIDARAGKLLLPGKEAARILVYGVDGRLVDQLTSRDEYVDISRFLNSPTGALLFRIIMRNAVITKKLTVLH
jgi:hypothetical protein